MKNRWLKHIYGNLILKGSNCALVIRFYPYYKNNWHPRTVDVLLSPGPLTSFQFEEPVIYFIFHSIVVHLLAISQTEEPQGCWVNIKGYCHHKAVYFTVKMVHVLLPRGIHVLQRNVEQSSGLHLNKYERSYRSFSLNHQSSKVTHKYNMRSYFWQRLQNMPLPGR